MARRERATNALEDAPMGTPLDAPAPLVIATIVDDDAASDHDVPLAPAVVVGVTGVPVGAAGATSPPQPGAPIIQERINLSPSKNYELAELAAARERMPYALHECLVDESDWHAVCDKLDEFVKSLSALPRKGCL